VYRQVREYRDRYPDKALMPMEEGTGPIPILMAGAAAPSALQSRPPTPPPTALESATGMYPQRATTTQVPGPLPKADLVVDRFVRTYLATELMKMSPKDGWVGAPEHTWVLAGDAGDSVLIDSLSGGDIVLAGPLPAREYKAMWFDPRTGDVQDAKTTSGAAQTVLTKPDAREWLLLLTLEQQVPVGVVPRARN
jgi:hypothetical protein